MGRVSVTESGGNNKDKSGLKKGDYEPHTIKDKRTKNPMDINVEMLGIKSNVVNIGKCGQQKMNK